MPVPIGSTLGMLEDNLAKRHSALPLSRRRATAWARGLHLPRGGEVVLYTGQMWQMVPTINAMAQQLAKYETGSPRLFEFARAVNRRINLTPFMARTRPADRRGSNERLRNIVRLLRSAGVEFGYLFEDDLYPGTLAYDEGLDPGFESHARYVAGIIQRSGAKLLITVDPHTTHMLRTVFPKVVPGFSVEVRSYLEVLAERRPKSARPLGEAVTFHDSCVYARYENVVEPPRQLLAGGGVTIAEPEMSGTLTFCCGGPLETLFPEKSADIAKRRVDQLRACDPHIVTACPLCFANLSRVATGEVEVRDISEYLVRAYCPATA